MVQTTFENLYAQAEQHPDEIALWVEGESLTFHELLDQTIHLASRLHATHSEQGLEGVIPILAQRTLKSAVAIFSAYYSGIPFTVIDEGTPLEAAKKSLSQLNINTPIWQPDVEDDAEGETLQLSKNLVDIPENNPDAFAYLILTSGSTGIPKGVMHTRNSTLAIRSTRFPSPLTERHASLSASTFAFAAGLSSLLLLSHGIRNYFIKPTNYTFGEFFAKVRELKPTYLHLPAQVARVYAKKKVEPVIDCVQHIAIGGEAVRMEHFRDFAQSFSPDTEFCHRLGASEGLCDLAWIGTHNDMTFDGQIPLHDSPQYSLFVPRPEYGEDIFELFVCGGLSLGYYNNDELTQEKFVIINGKRWWKSGDLLRSLGDSMYMHYGREDDLVKISGHLVSTIAVANAIMSLTDVDIARVTSEKEDDRFTLHAYIVLNPGSNATVETLRKDLQVHLPLHMFPHHFYILDSLPTTTRGKTDLRALRSIAATD